MNNRSSQVKVSTCVTSHFVWLCTQPEKWESYTPQAANAELPQRPATQNNPTTVQNPLKLTTPTNLIYFFSEFLS